MSRSFVHRSFVHRSFCVLPAKIAQQRRLPYEEDCPTKKIAQQNKIAQQRRLPSSKGMGILPIEEDLKWEGGKMMVAYSIHTNLYHATIVK